MAEASKAQAMRDAVMFAARDVGIATIVFRNELAKKLGLNLSESLCLTLLGVKGRLSPSELARLIGLSTGAATTMIDRLEGRGLARRIDNPKDRRGVLVELVAADNAEMKAMVAEVQAAHKALVGAFSSGELAVVKRFLRGFARNLASCSEDVRGVLGDALLRD